MMQTICCTCTRTECAPHDRSKVEFGPLLHHHADLLRECAAAPGPRLLDHRVRRDCAAQAGAGHRDVVFDRHGRARAEDRALGKGGRMHATGDCHQEFGRVSRIVGPAGADLRRFHPHHGGAAQARRPEAVRHATRQGIHLQGLVHGAVLRLRRGSMWTVLRARPAPIAAALRRR